MKYILFSIFCSVLLTAVNAQDESLSLEGVYQGKDLYVKNPFGQDGVGFCVYEVYVNDELTRDEVNSSAFAIDFSILNLKRGDALRIKLNHKEGCKPLILNPEVIQAHSTFEIKNISVKGNSLTWTTEKESGSLPFIVEQFRGNKGVRAGEVLGAGVAEENEYSFSLQAYSGENKVRVKQVDYTGKPRYSESVSYNANLSPVTYSPEKPEKEITFSRETLFEVFDKYGNLIQTGFGRKVDVSGLTPGEKYYLNYDSSFGSTFQKK
jgi:hypothetical protein